MAFCSETRCSSWSAFSSALSFSPFIACIFFFIASIVLVAILTRSDRSRPRRRTHKRKRTTTTRSDERSGQVSRRVGRTTNGMLRCCKAKLARSLARAAAGLPAQSLLLLLLLQLWDAVVAVLLDSRCYFNLRSKADISQLNRPRGNKKKLLKMDISVHTSIDAQKPGKNHK